MATSASTQPRDRRRAIPRDQVSPIQVAIDVCMFLVLFVTPWLISTQLKEVFNTTKNIWIGMAAVLAVLAWAADCLMRREIRIPKGRVVLLYVALIAWCAITISWSRCWRLSLVEFGFQLAMFAIFMVAYCNIYDRERIENLLHFSIAAGVITAGYALLQYYGFDDPIFRRLTSFFQLFLPDSLAQFFDFRFLILPPKPDEATKCYSFMGHRNYLAGYLIAVLPIVLSRLYASIGNVIGDREFFQASLQKFRDKGFDFDAAWDLISVLRAPLVYTVSLVLMFSTVILTHTRGSWVGFSIAAVVFFTCLYLKFPIYAGWRRSLFVVGIFVLLVGFFGPKQFGFGSFAFNNPLNKNPGSVLARVAETTNLLKLASAHQRLLIYRTALYIIFHKPWTCFFGTGFGTFGIEYMPYQKLVFREAPPKDYEKWKSNLLEEYAITCPEAREPRSQMQKTIDRFFEDFFFKGRRGTDHWVTEINKSIYAHNEVLHFWSEIGLVGIALITTLLFFFFRDSYRYLKVAPAADEALLYLGMMCSVVAVLGHNLFTFDLHLAYTASLFWFLIAVSQRYHDRGDWVFSWGARRSTETEQGGMRFRLALEETPEGAVAAVAEHVETETVSGSPVDYRLVLRDPEGDEVERKFPKSGPISLRRPPQAGEWTARIVGPEGTPVELDFYFEPRNPLATPVAFGMLGIGAFLVLRAILSQGVMENCWRDAFLKFRAHQFEEAFIDFKKALKQDPNRGEVLFDYGRSLMDSNRNAPAIKVFLRATASFVDPANYHNIALCYYKENDLVNAERAYRSALDLNIIYEQSLSNLAYLLMDKAARKQAEGNKAEAEEFNKEAEELLMRGIAHYRWNPQFSSTLGALRAQQGRLEEAAELFEKSVKADPKQCKVWINLGTVLYNLKRFGRAVEVLREGKRKCSGGEGADLLPAKFTAVLKGYYHELLAKNPTDKSIITSYGRDLLEAEQYTEAQEVFRKLLDTVAPGDPQASFLLAECYLKLDYRDKARTEFSRLKGALPPGHELQKEIDARLEKLGSESSPVELPAVTPSPSLLKLPLELTPR